MQYAPPIVNKFQYFPEAFLNRSHLFFITLKGGTSSSGNGDTYIRHLKRDFFVTCNWKHTKRVPDKLIADGCRELEAQQFQLKRT